MEGHVIDKCRTCGADVVMARSESSGVPMPVDASPVLTGGNVELLTGETRSRFRIVPEAEREGRDDLHLSHFATCPQADQWRTRR